MSELKYKVGDKFLVEMEIIETVEGKKFPYRLNLGATVPNLSFDEYELDVFASNQPIQKPKVPKAVVEYYEKYKNENKEFSDWFSDFYLVNFDKEFPKARELKRWLYCNSFEINQQHELALATLIVNGIDAVEVENEKKYKITLKANGQILTKVELAGGKVTFNFMDDYVPKPHYTKQELTVAGFGGVFDNSMFEVTEVE